MKLWIFVLLGLLAQTSHGCLQVQNYVIADRIKTTATGCAKDLKNTNLPDILIALVGKLQLNIVDIINVVVTSTYTGQGIFTLNVKATVQTGCSGLTPINVDISVTVKISQVIKNGKFCWTYDDSSTQITSKVSNKDAITATAGGVVNTILGSLTSILNSVLSTLNGTLKGLVGTITDTLTNGMTSLTDTINVSGKEIKCTPSTVTSTATSTAYTYTAKFGSGDPIPVIDPSLITELASGLTFGLSIGEGFLAGVLDFKISTFKFGLESFFGNLPSALGDAAGKKCQVKPQPPSKCNLTPSGGTLLQTCTITLFNELDEALVDIEAGITSFIDITLDSTQNVWTSVDNTQVTSWSLKNKYPGCGCNNLVAGDLDDLTAFIKPIVYTQIKSFLESSFSVASLNPYGPNQSGSAPVCSPKPKCVTCGY